jgi:hypothetical protein
MLQIEAEIARKDFVGKPIFISQNENTNDNNNNSNSNNNNNNNSNNNNNTRSKNKIPANGTYAQLASNFPQRTTRSSNKALQADMEIIASADNTVYELKMMIYQVCRALCFVAPRLCSV